MFARLYQNSVIQKPKAILALLIFCLLFFGYHTKDFKLDASSDTLLIENDPDLKYLREINERYGSKDFLVLTYSPISSFEDKETILNLQLLKSKIEKLSFNHPWSEMHFKKDIKRKDISINWVMLEEGKTIGYIFGLLTPMIGLGTANLNFLNITYNLADFVNKILFGLIIWNAAIKDTAASKASK